MGQSGNVDLFATGAETGGRPVVNPLDEALANLDRASTAMPGNPEFEGCGMCHSAADVEALRGPDTPDSMVLELFDGLLRHWRDFPGLVHRLTPRFLRLLARGEVDSTSYRDAGEVLWAEGWTTWPEHDAVHAVLLAWWRDRLDYSALQLLIPASREVMPWLREFECAPAALPDLIDEWCHELAFGDLGFDASEVIDWLFKQGLDLLTRLPDLDSDRAIGRLADLEYWLQTLERPPK
jgi:hypothetical protein